MKKKKTFKELFAGTGIEPTTNENGGVDYNFKATLKKEHMKQETTNHSFEPFTLNHTITTQSKPQSEFVYVSSSQPSAIVMISTQYQSLSDKEKLELLSNLSEWTYNKTTEIINKNK